MVQSAMLLPPFLFWQQRQGVAQLVCSRLALRAPGQKRSRRDGLATLGSVFGCTLGDIVSYVKQHGAKTSTVLIRLHACMRRLAFRHARMGGPDASALARGLACCRVAQSSQRRVGMRRLDSKYAHSCTILGGTVAVLCVLELLSHARNAAWILHQNVLRGALDRLDDALSEWREPDGIPALARTLAAERRAVCRAKIGASAAAAATTSTSPIDVLRAQLDAAARAVFPPTLVGVDTQRALCLAIAHDEIANRADDACAPIRSVQEAACAHLFVPLAELAACHPALLLGDSTDSGTSTSPSGSGDSFCGQSESSWECV
jgi:hypothetical protein